MERLHIKAEYQSLKVNWYINHKCDKMPLLKDNDSEQLRQLVKACLLEISKLKIELKKCQRESSMSSKETDSFNEFKEDTVNKLMEKDAKIADLQDILKEQNEKLEELQKIKRHFDALTTKPKKDLTSFQSQVYQLLPDEEDTMENLYNHIIEIGFSELTNENFEHVLHNLERKGYFQSSSREDEVFWKKMNK